MTLRDLAETSTILALHQPAADSSISKAEQSRSEFADYLRFLCHLWQKELDRRPGDTISSRIAEEILVSDLLLRVVTALGGCSEKLPKRNVDPSASGLSSELQRLFDRSVESFTRVAVELRVQRLQRRVERWTDLLLGSLPHGEHCGLAYDAGRYQEFRQGDSIDAGWTPLYLLSLRHWCPDREIDDDVRRGVFAKLLSLSLATLPEESAFRARFLRGRLGRVLPINARQGKQRPQVESSESEIA